MDERILVALAITCACATPLAARSGQEGPPTGGGGGGERVGGQDRSGAVGPHPRGRDRAPAPVLRRRRGDHAERRSRGDRRFVQRGQHRARRPREAPDPAGRRAGGDGPRRHRHPALRGRQGQPVLPARLQPGPRDRLRGHRRRDAGEHAHPRPRPGIRRPQLRDPGAGREGPVPQGSVPRLDRRLLVGRGGGLRPRRGAAPGDRPRHPGELRLRRGPCSATPSGCWAAGPPRRSSTSTTTAPGTAATTTSASTASWPTTAATPSAAGRSWPWARTGTGWPRTRSRAARWTRVSSTGTGSSIPVRAGTPRATACPASTTSGAPGR